MRVSIVEEGKMALSIVEAKLKRILDIYGTGLYRFAYSYLHNDLDAQEIVQDTLLRLLKYKPTFADEEKEKAWLFKTAANLSRNKLRYNKVRETDPLEEILAIREEKDLSFVWEAVKQLDATGREVIHLFYEEGYTTKEIGEILNRKEATIRSSLARAREKLKTILKEAYDFE